ncbi:glycoside hydrolase family 61 protein [Serendipita vermifera MAFF 305830]|uniref:AA9 family lytic polysaccharide monooxygenase n=1 Tax=Serendipita vermifera MAFF 305830 TaxID=933852 RepID=A0A0C2X1G7_SERVB|nr:glycoside hydrolase family 61 protein [Serendipita vermifera MAFF 305830]
MKSIVSFFALALAAIPQVAAHYRFTSLIVDGTTTAEYQYVRQNSNFNSPVTDVTSNDLRCNVGGATGSSTSTATVAAGATVGFVLDTPVYHPGVLNVYISKAPSDAASYDGSGGWFKIYEVTAVTNGGTSITFPTDNAAQFTFKIPSSIPSGEYLLRIEHIALHVAQSVGGAQFYISCAQLSVTGGGSASPATVSIPGVYKATDPGIEIGEYCLQITNVC